MNNQEMYQEVINGIVKGLPESEIPYTESLSKSFINKMTKRNLTYNEVTNENDQLSRDYDYLIKMFGFNNFYDMYSYADFCDNQKELLQKGGNKDLSRLHRVTRTVIRNGKPMKTTIYTDGGDDGDNDMNKESKEKGPKAPRKATQLSMDTLGVDAVGADPKEVASLSTRSKGLSGAFDSDCQSYMVLSDEEGVGAIAGFRVMGNYLYLAFTQVDGITSGVSRKSFYELLLRAWKAGLGAMIDSTENPLALALFKEYGLKKSGNQYKITRAGLEKSLGKR